MGEMAASIAHEIRQPLAAIVINGSVGLRWLANATPNVDEARAALTRIVNDSHRAGQVIASIRAMSEKGSQEKAWLDINEVIREVLALVDGELKSKRVSVCTEVDRRPAAGIAERIPYSTYLNFRSSMLRRQSRHIGWRAGIEVRVKIYEPAGVLIIVEDSGTGIDPKVSIESSNRSLRRNPMVWGLGCRFVGRLLKPTGDACRHRPLIRTGRSFKSSCRPGGPVVNDESQPSEA